MIATPTNTTKFSGEKLARFLVYSSLVYVFLLPIVLNFRLNVEAIEYTR